MRPYLVCAESRHNQHPDTFEIPSEGDRLGISVGDFAKVIFKTRSKPANFERMWIEVTRSRRGYYSGQLASRPVMDHGELHEGQKIDFEARNVIEIRSQSID